MCQTLFSTFEMSENADALQQYECFNFCGILKLQS